MPTAHYGRLRDALQILQYFVGLVQSQSCHGSGCTLLLRVAKVSVAVVVCWYAGILSLECYSVFCMTYELSLATYTPSTPPKKLTLITQSNFHRLHRNGRTWHSGNYSYCAVCRIFLHARGSGGREENVHGAIQWQEEYTIAAIEGRKCLLTPYRVVTAIDNQFDIGELLILA